MDNAVPTIGALGCAALGLYCAGCSSRSSPPEMGGDGGGGGPVVWTLADLGPGRCTAVTSGGSALGIDDTGASFVVDAATRTPLGALPDGTTAVGVAIADGGDVVGYSSSVQGRTAVRFHAGAWSSIASVPGAWSAALGISASGRVVGVSGTGAHAEMHGFALDANGAIDLALPASSSAAFLTTEDRVAGIFQTATNETHAFTVADGAMVDLGTLGGANSTPYGINRRGDVAGASETSDGGRHAFVAPTDAAVIDLGVPTGAIRSEARGIDDQRHIAGNAYDATGLARPVVFAIGQPATELLPTDPAANRYVSAHVAAMSPSGFIVGWAARRDESGDAVHCLLWTPGAAP